jgi:hypothetical protein
MGLLLLSSGLAAACADSGPPGLDRPAPEIRLGGVTFRVYREERLAAAGEAASVSYRRDTGDIAAETLAVSFPDPAEGPAPRLLAPRARGNARSRDLLAEGGLRMERGPDVATTEEARYDPDDRLVHGGWPVAIRGPGWVLEGPAFVLDPAAGRLQIPGGVRLDVRDLPGRSP